MEFIKITFPFSGRDPDRQEAWRADGQRGEGEGRPGGGEGSADGDGGGPRAHRAGTQEDDPIQGQGGAQVRSRHDRVPGKFDFPEKLTSRES